MRTDAKECREFLRTLSMVSAAMASLSFIGISIILAFWEIDIRGPMAGFFAVGLFAIVSFLALAYARPWKSYTKRELIKKTNKLMRIFMLSLVYFLFMVMVLTYYIMQVAE